MTNIQHQPFSNKIWIFFFSVVLLVCIAAICFLLFISNAQTAVIYVDGKEFCRVDLSHVTESYTIPLDGNTILVEPGGISMQSATCPDKLCIRQGTLHSVGRIVCLPNRVVIEMVNAKDAPDAKVG